VYILLAFQEEGPGFVSCQVFEGVLLLLDKSALSILLIVQFKLIVTSSYRATWWQCESAESGQKCLKPQATRMTFLVLTIKRDATYEVTGRSTSGSCEELIWQREGPLQFN